MQTTSKWYSLAVVLWIPGLIFAVLAPVLLVYPLAALFWYVVGKKLQPARGLALFLAVEEKLPKGGKPKERPSPMPIIKSASGQETGYFFESERFPNIPSRTLRVFLPTLGLSLWLSNFVPTLDKVYPWVTAVVLAIPVLLVLPFLLFPIWVYEDSGLRWYNKSSGTITVPGAAIKIFLPGLGVLLTIIALFGKWMPVQILEFAGALIFFVLPVALFGAVMFSYRLEPALLAKFMNSSAVHGISRGTVTVDRAPVP